MKLFQKLIVAPAALGFLVPSAAFAEEIKLADISNYSSSKQVKSISDFDPVEKLTEINSRLDDLEPKFNDFEAGGFSETTTMKGKAKFVIGSTEGPAGTDEAIMTSYFYEIDLNTSFTGEDNLNVEIETGNNNGSTSYLSVIDFGKEFGDALRVSDLNYTFPFRDYTVTIGDSLDASKQFTGACSYGNTVDALSDCGTGNSIAVGGDQTISIGRELDSGWSFGFGLSADDGETASGVFTEEGEDIYALNVAYTGEDYGVALAYSNVDVATYWGLNASYSPDGFPTISGGYEFGSPDTGSDTTQFAIGLSSDLGDGSITIGMGTNGAIADGAEETYAYDLSYSYDLNDSMSVTPFVFLVEGAGGADDTTGFGAEVGFKF